MHVGAGAARVQTAGEDLWCRWWVAGQSTKLPQAIPSTMALPLLLSAVSLIPHAGSPLPTTGVVVRRPLLLAASQAGRPVAPEGSLLAVRPLLSAPQLPAKRPNVLLAVLLALYVSNQWARTLPSYLVSFDPVSMQAAGAGHRLLNVGLGFNQARHDSYHCADCTRAR